MPQKNSTKKTTNMDKSHFISITNREIYESIQEHNEKIEQVIKSQEERLRLLEDRLLTHNKLIYGAYAFGFSILSFMIAYVIIR